MRPYTQAIHIRTIPPISDEVLAQAAQAIYVKALKLQRRPLDTEDDQCEVYLPWPELPTTGALILARSAQTQPRVGSLAIGAKPKGVLVFSFWDTKEPPDLTARVDSLLDLLMDGLLEMGLETEFTEVHYT